MAARFAIALVCGGLAGTAAAQDLGWTFEVSPYAWVPGTTTTVGSRFGDLEADASVSDTLSSLDFAAMAVFEARNGRWGLIADLFYADLSEGEGTPFDVAFSGLRIETKLAIGSGYVGYRVFENERVAVDALAGFRIVSADLDVTLAPGILPGQQFGVDDTWADPLIGARVHVPLSDRWFTAVFADLGGLAGNSELTWQAEATVGYRFAERVSAQVGWRHLVIERDIKDRDAEIELSGPLIGLTIAF